MNVIYVDDEKLQLTNFRLTVEEMKIIDSLETFGEGEKALAWAEKHPVDVEFLDIEMRGMNGIELARHLKAIDENIQVVFVTAYEQYALEAYGVDAIGYLLKPYLSEDIEKHLKRAGCFRKIPKKEIQIHTMPEFSVSVNGKPILLGRNKPEELFALLVDRGESGLFADKSHYNGLKIAENATAYIYIPEGTTLTVYGQDGANATNGGDATEGEFEFRTEEIKGVTYSTAYVKSDATSGTAGSGAKGGGAAIYVAASAKLVLFGGGTLKATGGKGGNAGAGGLGGASQYYIITWYADNGSKVNGVTTYKSNDNWEDSTVSGTCTINNGKIARGLIAASGGA